MTAVHDETAHRPTDPRPLLDRAIRTAGAVIDGVRAEQLTEPTPCETMDVRAMIGHLVGVLGRITALGQGEDVFAVVERPAPRDAWSEAWAAAAERAVAAWSEDSHLTRPTALPWVQGTGAEVLTSYLSELTVHTWDLATATGQEPSWDDEVLVASLAASDFLPAEGRLAVFEQVAAAMGAEEVAVPFAEAVPVPADASAIHRLVAWNGRDPRR